jgi:hypothetical protein
LPFCRWIRQWIVGKGNSRGSKGAVTEHNAERYTYGHLHYPFNKKTEWHKHPFSTMLNSE